MANGMTGFPSNGGTLKTMKLGTLSLVPQSEVKRGMALQSGQVCRPPAQGWQLENATMQSEDVGGET